MRRIRIVIADRHPVFLQGISSVFATQRDFAIVASCSDGASCIEAIQFHVPDIALVDAEMPDMRELEILALANSAGLGSRVIFFTTADHAELQRLAAEGACAVLTKEAKPEVLVKTLRQIVESQGLAPLSRSIEEVNGGARVGEEMSLAQLTERERQIMRLVSEGLSNKEIGRRLNLADGTIKVHLHHIFQKLDISNRTVLAALAISRDELHAAPREFDPPGPLQRDRASAK